jgi:hypothetical protein
MKNIVSLVICMGAISACSHEVAVTYDSVPSGATVSEQGIGTLGVCPVTVKYNADDVKVSDGKLYTDRIKVVWVSGAKLFMDPTAIDLGPDGRASYIFTRPQGFVHFEGDDSSAKDDRFAVAFEDNLPVTRVKHIVTPGQRRGFFERFDTGVTCAYAGITENPYARCE